MTEEELYAIENEHKLSILPKRHTRELCQEIRKLRATLITAQAFLLAGRTTEAEHTIGRVLNES